MRRVSVAALAFSLACSSSSPAAIDPIAEAYCAAGCSELNTCERVITDTIQASCTEETGAYYQCVTDAACDESACGAEWEARNICMNRAPVDQVRVRIAALAFGGRVVNLGHRGTGTTTADNPLPENSIPSFEAAIDEGADGIEVDVEITMDGQVIVMHDDTLDRTTDCTGCVSQMTLDDIRSCRLLDGDGNVTDQRPPTLLEVYDAIGGNALINLELKVFSDPCLTSTTDAEALVDAVLDEVIRIGGESRTIFSSFDTTAVELLKTKQPGFYSALLSRDTESDLVETALALGQDAIHPFFTVSEETVQEAREAGLQVNVWTVDPPALMQEQIDKGVDTIITNDPATLAELLSEPAEP